MTGLEIFLLVLVVLAVFIIAYQAQRNQALARSLWLRIAKPRPGLPLPPAAETISLAAFNRATDRRDAENQRLGARLQEVEAKAECAAYLNRVGAVLVTDYALQHAKSESEVQRLTSLYMTAERERERLARELQRLHAGQGFIAVVH